MLWQVRSAGLREAWSVHSNPIRRHARLRPPSAPSWRAWAQNGSWCCGKCGHLGCGKPGLCSPIDPEGCCDRDKQRVGPREQNGSWCCGKCGHLGCGKPGFCIPIDPEGCCGRDKQHASSSHVLTGFSALPAASDSNTELSTWQRTCRDTALWPEGRFAVSARLSVSLDVYRARGDAQPCCTRPARRESCTHRNLCGPAGPRDCTANRCSSVSRTPC